ncbi:MAG TPA: type II toxin-antitoxin system VapC family toxin [Chloroflexi bacterium]|nr:type II toxin-antitoxin system VapC family toxin [Chloroflexota bacterium]
MNVVDSSGWLEYFADGHNADFFAQAIENIEALIVPVISVYEVFKRVYQQRGEGDALQAVAMMEQGQVVKLDSPLALSAARISIDLKIPMADSIILATARAYKSTLWTQDVDFKGIDGVQYIEKG